jgi:glycosyltransferase involved in cell wall biosynthesis
VHLLHIPEEKIRVVHLGVHPRFRPVTDRGMLEGVRQRYHIPGEYILYVGTLQPRKNVVRLIEAFARVHCALEQGYNGIGPFDQTDTRRSLHLVLAGARGWQDQRMADAIVRLGLGPWVHLIGYVDEADLPALYSGARVFVLPSLWEGFGLPILEAMACGTPVVAANVSSLPEVVGDAGLLADPKDVGALARALMHVVMDPELSIRLRRRGLQRAAQFTWQRCAEATLAVLEEARQIA